MFAGVLLLLVASFHLIPVLLKGQTRANWPAKPVRYKKNPLRFSLYVAVFLVVFLWGLMRFAKGISATW